MKNKSKNNKEILSFKVITLGESGVGKTSIIERFLYNKFDDNCLSTIGLSFSYKDITLKNKEKIQIKLIDTGGQEKFRALAKSYFKNADGVLFVYAKDNQNSFDNIRDWIILFNENHNGKEGIPQYLVETKSDLDRVVDENRAQEFAKENNMKWISTSSKDNNSINELFDDIAELLYASFVKNNKGKKNQKKILINSEKKKSSHCCLYQH